MDCHRVVWGDISMVELIPTGGESLKPFEKSLGGPVATPVCCSPNGPGLGMASLPTLCPLPWKVLWLPLCADTPSGSGASALIGSHLLASATSSFISVSGDAVWTSYACAAGARGLALRLLSC